MATSPIRPQGLPAPSPSVPAPAPKLGREATTRPASLHGAAAVRAPRPAETLEVQLARIFARHAMQAQRASSPEESAKSVSGRTRGANLDIHV